jgi:hypothetical protein
MNFNDALAAVDAMSPQEQMNTMITFRQTAARFEDVRLALSAAVEEEMANRVETPAPQPWRFNWFGFAGLCLAALSFGAVSAWIYTLIRLMGAGQ